MKPAIIFLDLEGTLIRVPVYESDYDVPVSMWTVLAKMLGEECYKAEEESKHRWLESSNQQYLEWMNDSVKTFISYGLNQKIFVDLLEMIEIIPGVIDFCTRMGEVGAKICIVTGAIKNVAEIIQIKTQAHHLFAGCELYFDADGYVQHWNLLPSDYRGKADFMRLMINEYGVSPEECVFIGDGNNDMHLAKEVGLSIAYNAHHDLKKIATYIVDQKSGEENFLALADIITNH